MRSSNVYDIELAWAAVAAADRINGGKYFSQNSLFSSSDTSGVPLEDRQYNKTIAYDMLESPDLLTEEDRNFGGKLREHFQGLLLQRLTGNLRNSFLNNVADIVAKDQVNRYEIACMAVLPKTYRSDLEREAKTARQQAMFSTSEYLGEQGSRHSLAVEILDTIYSRKYNIYIVTATDGKSVVKFSTAKDPAAYPVGKRVNIKGSVKRCEENNRTGVKETWLTRVKFSV